MTLYLHARDAQASRPILGDLFAADLLRRVDHDPAGAKHLNGNLPVICTRARLIDDIARRFLDRHPDAGGPAPGLRARQPRPAPRARPRRDVGRRRPGTGHRAEPPALLRARGRHDRRDLGHRARQVGPGAGRPPAACPCRGPVHVPGAGRCARHRHRWSDVPVGDARPVRRRRVLPRTRAPRRDLPDLGRGSAHPGNDVFGHPARRRRSGRPPGDGPACPTTPSPRRRARRAETVQEGVDRGLGPPPGVRLAVLAGPRSVRVRPGHRERDQVRGRRPRVDRARQGEEPEPGEAVDLGLR